MSVHRVWIRLSDYKGESNFVDGDFVDMYDNSGNFKFFWLISYESYIMIHKSWIESNVSTKNCWNSISTYIYKLGARWTKYCWTFVCVCRFNWRFMVWWNRNCYWAWIVRSQKSNIKQTSRQHHCFNGLGFFLKMPFSLFCTSLKRFFIVTFIFFKAS